MKNLEKYIEAIIRAESVEQAFDSFCEAMGEHGYDRITYSLVNEHPSLGLPSKHGLATSYPQAWMQYYEKKNYALADPVTKNVLSSRLPFYWDDVTAKLDRASLAHKVMNEAADAGINDGIGISLRGQDSELAGIGIARESPLFKERRDSLLLGNIFFLSTCFHETYRDLTRQIFKTKFSDRERDILSWAAEGKTDSQIRAILSIATTTVRYYWTTIGRKLGVTGRTYTIVKALKKQLIDPAMIRAR